MITQEEIETLRKILQKFDDGAKERVSHVDRLVELAISQFDFEEVHDYMKSVNWKWARNGGLVVPTIDEMSKHAEHLIRSACSLFEEGEHKQDTQVFSGSGGFEAHASRETADSEVDHVKLMFVLAYSEEYI